MRVALTSLVDPLHAAPPMNRLGLMLISCCALFAACNLCNENVSLTGGGSTLCQLHDGGLGVQRYQGKNEVSAVACSVTVDGGTLAVDVTATICTPVTPVMYEVPQVVAGCDVSKVPPGTYALEGQTFTLPFPSDAGRRCNE